MKRDRLNMEFPEIVKEWDYDKNIDLMPEMFTGGSHKDVWWKCKRGHSWQARISNRVYGKQGCPYCSGQRVVQGVKKRASVLQITAGVLHVFQLRYKRAEKHRHH